ncbi:nuclear pore complex protein gp210 [Phtheirospermum japonicum]|uniref:Nuclear pore complex protein gp210 n=1 Tax=Phtheirospermum japonicum TaxID=374723 RepID=A0A830BZ24_9LAMI|nr:nuclear pore complex protein gp210 [Phtheirospermum japonicum]
MSTSTPLLISSLLLLILHRTASYSGPGPHIADVNILLPPKMTHPVEYRLQGSDGCFKWSWDHHDILSVLPEFNSSSHCSTSARLKSIAPYGGRQETAVYATDLNTGSVIRCKVYIDMISRIQIFHNSIKLDLDGLATLRVRAFDSEDNVFSSLVGLKFMWQLMPESHGLPDNLVHVPLKDSPLSDCGGLFGDLDIQAKLEESGVFSDLYVVKGTEIGHEIVSVNLLEPSLEHLADKIVLTVAEAMSLDPPSPVYVLIGAAFHYTLKVIRSNSPHVVSLPSPFHQWSILNSSVAEVDGAKGTVRAVNLGVTSVVVEDTRVVGHMQISSLHVVLPDNLVLFISPLSLSGDRIEGVEPIPSISRWYAVSGRMYLVHVKVFSPGPGAREIFMTENDEIELHDDSRDEFWNIIPVSEDAFAKKNYRILNANSHGLGKLTATLTYSTGRDISKEVVKVVQEITICDPVQFVMEGDDSNNVSRRILLPWVPGVYQELELKVNGGCAVSSSDYKWFSSDMAVLSVSVSGVVQAKKPGKATIRAVSLFDPLNYDELVVEVSIPHSMVVLPNFPVETTVGSHLQASVTLKASSGAFFHACDAFRSFIRWNTESDSFVIVNATEELFFPDKKEAVELRSLSFGPPCAWTRIYASNPGRTVVHATLNRENQLSDHTGRESIALKVSSCIAAHSPLIVHQASDGNQFGGYWFDLSRTESQNQLRSLDDLYLTPGTHLDVMLRGGPERWGKDVEFIENVEVLDEQIFSQVKNAIFVRQMSTRYRIGCESLGTFRVIFRRGNLIGENHRLPVISEVQLLLTCSFPSSIVILADEALNAHPVIKSAAQAERMPGGIRVRPITVANGRRIRVSAVSLSDSGKAFANSSSLRLSWELTECERLALLEYASYSSWETFLILQNTSGLCVVRSTVVGLIESLTHLDIAKMFESPTDTLTDAVQLQLVSSLRVSPEFSLLFFSPEARLNISISGGTCFLEKLVNDTQIVEIIQQRPAYKCSQLTLAPKSLGPALVTVHDTGLAPPLAASSVIQVAEMDWIKILTRERLSIMEGDYQSVNFSVGVGDGRLFDPSQYVYMNIHVHIGEAIVEVVENHAPNFTLRANHLGVTTIYLSATQHSGHEIRSQPVTVEVYAPPRIHPVDIFLVPGASYVLTVRGGPQIGSHVQYASLDDQTAEIHQFSGRLSAISPGNSTLVATIYGDGDVMLCRAYAEVKVGIPSSAVLNVQSEHLAIDRTVPVYPSLSEGNLFSFYELCNNFEWTLEDEDVLTFQRENHARDTGRDLNFIQVLRGISAGETNVTVSFSCNYKLANSISKPMFYSASISLRVVSDLPLALGSPITWILPSYYTSSDLLPSSSHSPSDKGIAYSLLGQCKRKTEEVQNDDIYIDGAKIKTKDSGNLACIQAKDRSTGRIEVASCVKVAEVSQIRITTDEFPIHMLSVGAELDLPIKYHDTLGNPFHEAHNLTLFEVETNDVDILSFDKYDGRGKLHLRAKRQGVALVQISFGNNPRKAVYAIISVGPQLYPQNPVIQQGANLNFEIKGSGDLAASGHWFSANESVVFVEKLSGKAEAIGEGTTHVRFESLSSGSKLHTVVTVLKGNIVSVEAPREILTNVPFPVKGYAFAVKFSDDARKIIFECAVDPPNIGFAKPSKDPKTGNSYCLFFPYSPEHIASSSPDTLHQVSVTIKASLGGDRDISGSASALFIGGFTILEMDKNSLRLNLTRDSNKGVVTVIGNTDVDLNWHDKNRLSVKPIHGEGHTIAKYEVKVLGAEKLQDQLIFSLPATGQRIDIDVSYEAEEIKAVLKPGNVTLWGCVLGLLLLIPTVIFVICYLDRADRPDRSQRLGSGSPSVAAPVTPERSSHAVISDQSPRTPPPFIEYVRRTIDETPYYRQDFRRRANPQNTF